MSGDSDRVEDREWERRQFLQAASATAAVPFSGCLGLQDQTGNEANVQSMNPTAQQSSESLQIGPELNLGGRQVVAAPDAVGYDTIQGAWDDAESGDIIFVHSSYDAQEAGETFPIVLNYEQKEVTLTGGHPSGSVIDASHTDNNVIEVLGRAQNDFRNLPLVQHLKIIGGNVGLRIRAAPYSTYKDLVFWKTGSHGIEVEGYTDERGDIKGAYGITFRRCVAWSCRGAGFKVNTSARPHSTTFYGCQALFNGLYGPQTGQPGVQLRGYASRWNGGSLQNNGGFGIDARGGGSQTVHGTYFEGNGTVQSSPHDVYVGDTAPGFSLDSCYFQGHFARNFPNGLDDSFRAIAIVGAPSATVRDCTYRNYTETFVYVRRARDVDIYEPSHVALDETEFLDNGGSNERLRSQGIIMETDLRASGESGSFVGDYGLHDGSGQAPWGLALWNGENWISVMNGESLS